MSESKGKIKPKQEKTAQTRTPAVTNPHSNPPVGEGGSTHEKYTKRLKNAKPWIDAFGIVVLIVYAGYTACMSHSMREANKLTRDALQVSQGAYVVIGRKDGVVAEFITPKADEDESGIVIYFQNSGRLPAKFNWGLVTDMPDSTDSPFAPVKSVHKFAHMTRTRNRKTGARGESTGAGGLIGADSVYIADVANIRKERFANLSSSKKILLLNGRYEYCDELSRYTCREFSIFYQGSPYNRFALGTDTVCTWPYFTELASGAEPDIEYLPPCRTTVEAEQGEKDSARQR